MGAMNSRHPHGQHVALDALQSLVRVVISLLHQAQLLTLLLVETHRSHVLQGGKGR